MSHPPPAGLSFKKETLLTDARVYSHNGTVIDSQNQIRRELSPDLRPPPSGHRLLKIESLPPPLPLSGHSLNLSAPASWKNYYHWLIETAPKLRHYLPHHNHLLTPLHKPYHRETLIAAGIPEEKWITLEKTTHFRCPQLTAFPPQKPAAENLAYLRSLFLPENLPAPTQKIYISRRDTWRRRMRNEDQLITLLEKSGYEIHTLSDLTIRKQAALFASATHLIAAHGAALANLVFCQPGTQVLELFSENYQYDHYEDLASTCHLHYQKHISPNKNNDPKLTLELTTLPEL